MQRAPSLPLLPGFNFDTKIGQTRFHRRQNFDKIHDGVYYLSERTMFGNLEGFSKFDRYPSVYPRGEVRTVPPWLAFDGQRLMFKAYFQETVQERWSSNFQIRVVTISFFLEDGTIKISEPPVNNSGLEQGVLLRRQRIPMPEPASYRFYDILDLNIGKEPQFFGRVYKIVDCDEFTRRFLNRMGIPVPNSLEIPSDRYNEGRKVEFFPKKPNLKIDTLGQFLKNDRKVLRFYGYWDDSDSPFGVVHHLEIHYYLADDTIEIKENIPPNSGRDSGVTFVKRTKIPKFYSRLDPIGAQEPYTVLNVLGENAASTYYVVDPLDTGKFSKEYYKDNDLAIGARISVFGREVVIVDLDPFTKEYYRKKYGINDFTPLEIPNTESSCKSVKPEIPPYNGFGSYDDSLGNCFSVIPKAPKMNFTKFYNYDKHGFDGHVLRYRAKMISNIPENVERHFIIRIFLMDDTVSIFELAPRNSGFVSSLFQKRMRVMLPGQNVFTNKPPKYYEPQDFYVGARLNLCEFHFLLTSADVYTLRYMELHCDKFPKANIKLIMEKLRESLKPVYKEFLKEYCPCPKEDIQKHVLEYRRLKEALCKYLGDKITEHEMITTARHYSSHEKKEFYSREYIRRLVHTEITRLLWNDLDRLSEDLRYRDRMNTGYLSRHDIYTVLRGCRVPMDIELLNSMLDHLKTNEEGKIDYHDLLEVMNVKINPVTPVVPVNIKTALWWASEKEPDCGAGIDWCAFLKDLNIEDESIPETGKK
ncbi:EF-hand domain-containing family member C2 [Orussus abietinus]|uniref:EF-hand domain-containing family member C2 n=1 Tax=Orussus abietinus TaxID=222816 RepID=UPI000624FFFF|nr:EF-hand domain-containing family member C2 [Orussus abietinus]